MKSLLLITYVIFFSSGCFRQVQNLRDELYQSKLRLEKETSSLKEANKVRFEFSKFLPVAMYEENKTEHANCCCYSRAFTLVVQ